MITGLLILAVWFAVPTLAICTAARIRRRTRRIPAAADNQPGRNVADLSTCRHIADQPTASRKEEPRA